MHRGKIIIWILIFICAGMIFHLSHQPASESNEVSESVTEKIVDLSERIRQLPPEEKQPIIKQLNQSVRKYAHFMLYTILGALVMLLFWSYQVKMKKAWILTLIICLIYAISDEVHQLFVDGRGCQLQDVFIDFGGIFLGSSIIARITNKTDTKQI